MEEKLDPRLEAFLEASTLEDKYEKALEIGELGATDYLVDTMGFSLDIVIPQEGDAASRYRQLLSAIKTRMTYEKRRRPEQKNGLGD